MLDAFQIAATGMQAQQLNVDTIANNLANVNTTGFKKGRVSFTDLMMNTADNRMAPGAADAMSGMSAMSGLGPLASLPRLGSGVGVSSVARLFEAGTLTQTGSAWDMAIQGDGFLQVAQPDGSTAFSRGGTLKVNAEGLLSTSSGLALKPGIHIPPNALSVAIAVDGVVSVTLPNQARPVDVGQLQLVRFANPVGLDAQGDNVYRATDASGDAIAGSAGREGIGTLQQGSLEASNVKMVDEIVGLMVAQRAYEASVKLIQAADEMYGMANNLRK